MATIFFATSILFNFVILVWFLRFRNGLIEWKEKVDASIVRGVMEDNPELADKVVRTYKELRVTYAYPENAMEAARRLHGLEP